MYTTSPFMPMTSPVMSDALSKNLRAYATSWSTAGGPSRRNSALVLCQGSCCAATIWSAREKKRRGTFSPSIPTYPVPRVMALVHHPGITAVKHLLQVTRPRTLDGEGFLLFDNTVIGWALDSSQHPDGYRKIRIVQSAQDIGKTRRWLGFIVSEDIILGHTVFTERHN